MSLTCLLSFGLLTAGMASNPSGNDKESTNKKIQSAVSLPKEFKTFGFSEKVKVIFTVDEKGIVNYEVAVTKNAALKQEIEKQFKQICFKELAAKTPYTIAINFIVK